MNALFVNIKVDREERPDIDRIYQIAHQMLIQRGGGWPLTMFLSPHDQHPFFGGTYFPRDARYGMPSFRDLLQRVAQFYRESGAKIEQQSAALQRAFADMLPPPSTSLEPFDEQPLARAPRVAGGNLRCTIRRLRQCTEVSASDQHRVPVAPLARHGDERRTRPAFAVHGDA